MNSLTHTTGVKFRFIVPIVTFPALAVYGFAPAANPLTFNMKDPKGVSGMSISIDSKLEPVHGYANGVTGTLIFDPAAPEKSQGTIVVDMQSVTLGSAAMSDSMKGDFCLDVAKFPNSKFELVSVKKVKKVSEGTFEFTAEGNFTLKDVTRKLTVSGTATHQTNMIKKRGGLEGVEGDLLTIRTKFSFKRSDYKLAPDLSTEYIGDQINIDFSSVGICPR
ncbi:MAG: YceI family protein [Armatimonadetes bacterium]|nr:YceI family protein [Armatimonadota bacterium]